MTTIKRQSDGTKLPKDLRTNLRALRRFYGTSDVGAVVELRREAGRVWRRYLKRRRVTEAVVLDIAFGWHGVDDDRVGGALRADGDIPAPVIRRVLALARRGRAIVDGELPEREAAARNEAYAARERANAGSFMHMVHDRIMTRVGEATDALRARRGDEVAVDRFLGIVVEEVGVARDRRVVSEILCYASGLHRSSATLTRLNVFEREFENDGQIFDIVRGFRRCVHEIRNGAFDAQWRPNAAGGAIERPEEVSRLGAETALKSFQKMHAVLDVGGEICSATFGRACDFVRRYVWAGLLNEWSEREAANEGTMTRNERRTAFQTVVLQTTSAIARELYCRPQLVAADAPAASARGCLGAGAHSRPRRTPRARGRQSPGCRGQSVGRGTRRDFGRDGTRAGANKDSFG